MTRARLGLLVVVLGVVVASVVPRHVTTDVNNFRVDKQRPVQWDGMTEGPWVVWYAEEAFEDCTDISAWPAADCSGLNGGRGEIDGWFPASPGSFPVLASCLFNKRRIKETDTKQDFCCATKRPIPTMDDAVDCPEDPDTRSSPLHEKP